MMITYDFVEYCLKTVIILVSVLLNNKYAGLLVLFIYTIYVGGRPARFHSRLANSIEKLADYLYCVAIVFQILIEIFSLQLSFVVSLPILWIPLIFASLIGFYMEYYTVPEDSEKLLLGTSTFHTAEEAIRAVYRFHYVTSHLGQSRESTLWIEGYMKMHSAACLLGNSCGLCYYYHYMRSHSENKGTGLNPTETKILNVFKKMQIRRLLKSFPQSTELKLAYLALADPKEHKDKSLIRKLRQSPGWVLWFQLGRWKARHKKGKSAAKKMKGERQAILEAAVLLSRFWELLEDENSSVTQVFDIGKRAFNSLELVKSMEKERADENTSSHALYKKLMQTVFLENPDSSNSGITSVKGSDQKRVSEKAWVKFSTKSKTMWKIVGCSQSFCKLFGYGKMDLVGKCITDLVPRMYLKYVNQVAGRVLDAYWKPLEENASESITFQIWGLHRNEYVFPIKATVEKMASAFKGYDMTVAVDIEKKNFSPRVLYLLTDHDLFIQHFSSSTVLFIQSALVSHKKGILTVLQKKKEALTETSNVAHFIPDLFSPSWEDTFCTKEGSQTCLCQDNNPPDESPIPRPVWCRAGRIDHEKQHIGYWFRIETVDDDPVPEKSPSVPDTMLDGGFVYNETLNKYFFSHKGTQSGVAEQESFVRLQYSRKGTRSKLGATTTENDEGDQSAEGDEKKTKFPASYFYLRMLQTISTGQYAVHFEDLRAEVRELMRSKNYGASVKIYRLIEGELFEIDEQNSCLVEEAFDTSLEAAAGAKPDHYVVADAATIAKKVASRDQFVSKMNSSTDKTGAKRLLWSVVASASMLIFIMVLEYLLTTQNRGEAQYRTEVVRDTFTFMENLYTFAFGLERVLYSHQGFVVPYQTVDEVITKEKERSDGIIDYLSGVEAGYYLDSTIYKERFPVWYPYSYNGEILDQLYSYNETLNFLMGDMIEISGEDYRSLTSENPSVQRFRNVVIGTFSDTIYQFGYYSIQALNDYNNGMAGRVQAFYISITIIILAAAVLIIPFLISSTKEGRHIMNQLLHVPKRVVQNTQIALEEVITAASGKNKADDQEGQTHEQYVLQMERLSKRGSQSGNFSGKLFYVSYYFVPIGVLFLITQGLALGRFMLFKGYTEGLDHVSEFYAKAVSLPAICLKALLYQEELLLPSNTTISNADLDLLSNSIRYLRQPLNYMTDSSQYAFSKTRLEQMQSIEKGNLCLIKELSIDCSGPLGDVASQGLAISVMEYIRLLKGQLESFVNNGSRNEGLHKSIVDLLFKVILPAHAYKETVILAELSGSYDFKRDSKNVFFACVIVAICLIYGCIWIPIIVHIRRKIHTTGCILGLIPYPVLISNPRLVQFMEKRLGILKG